LPEAEGVPVYLRGVDRCDECGFVYDTVARNDVANALRELAVRYDTVLAKTGDDALRAHPVAGTWSALEYGCHVRDVFRVQRERVLLALAEEQPAFASMRREERVLEERYNDQQPELVAREITDAAESFAQTLEALNADEWQRTGTYNWPERRVRTVEWIGRHTIHEGEHHLRDIDRLVGLSQPHGK
jgi:S-DNA-T family DNA segregation ATPase FtsK/SpoIIIE